MSSNPSDRRAVGRRLWLLLLSALLTVGTACSDDGDAEATLTQPTTPPSTTSTTLAPVPGQPARTVDLADVGFQPLTMVTDGSSLWLGGSCSEGGRIARSALDSGRPAWAVDVPDSPVGLAVSGAGVLFSVGGGDGANPSGGITRLDAESGNVLGTLELPGASPYGVAATPQAVWATDAGGDRVWRLDPRTGDIKDTVRVATGPTGIAYAGDSVWVASPNAGTVTRLDAATGARRGTVNVPTANSVVGNPSSVWVGGSALVRIDSQTGKETGRIATPGVVTAQALGSGWVWAHQVGGGLVRGETDGLRLDGAPLTSGEFVVAVTAGDSLWVSDGTKVAEWHLPLPTTLEFSAETVPAGVNFGFVRGLEGDEVIFDPAEELTDPRATELAVLDGASVTKEEGLPGGFYDRDRDGKTYRLPLHTDAALLLMKGIDPGFGPVHVDRDTFRRALKDTSSGEFYGIPALYHLTMKDGAVTRLENIYRP